MAIEDKYDQWKSKKIDSYIEDGFQKIKPQLLSYTLGGAPVSAQGMFGIKKSASDTPRVDNKNKFTR